MSHVAKIELEVTDLKVLSKAAQRLGCTFKENQTIFEFYAGQKSVCDHVIRVPNSTYEVGVIKSKANPKAWDLSWDNWATGGLTKTLGVNAGLLKQAYGIEATKAAAKAKGYIATEKKTKDGIQVIVTM